ncbi:MAG: tRNA pseudouridine(55) synthase TruB [Treponema sp.]|nr:tRNA pseudouridine(55) synthase TruB [Treponema sp.]
MESGLILFIKPRGVTSFDALRDIKRALGTGKVGHTGTLDKFAGGLLLVLTGNALKLSRWFSHCDKKYRGRICFGKETDTLDPEGKETAKACLPSRDDVEKALSQFKGEILQEPPVFSAIHVNGKRASSLARSGNAPEMKKRKVTIYKLELTLWEPPFAEIFAHCSSGTYIRSLARDIALAANSRGYLTELLRTDVAGFSQDKNNTKAQSYGEHTEPDENETTGENNFKVLPVNKEIISKLGLPWIDVPQKEAKDIIHGKPLENIFNYKDIDAVSSNNYANPDIMEQSLALFYNETLTAIIEKQNGKWKYGCVM